MARANIARRQGDDFQARLFWLSASSLLDPHSPIARVAYESGPKSFDDILVEYDPNKAPPDHEGKPLFRRHIQCKWHTTAGTFGHADLIDPDFINADSCSLLQRVRRAQSIYATDGLGCRFELKTNWRIRSDDPLIQLVRKESDAIDNARLFDGTTDRSRMGQVRKLWREHLHLDEEQLRLMTRTLALVETTESLTALRERLDERFAIVGLRRVPAAETSFLYDDLIFKLLAQGRVEFDKDTFRAMCLREDLLREPIPSPDALTIGIRSFMHPIDNLEDRCDRMLNLVPYFEGRYIRNPAVWHLHILPEIQTFVMTAAKSRDRLRLILDAHTSIAFAIGSILNVKSGKQIEIEQRAAGRRFWSLNDSPTDSSWPNLLFEEELLTEKSDEIAIAVSLTHDVSSAVRIHFTKQPTQIRGILHCRPETGPSQQAVRCGHHAAKLAEALSQHVQELRESGQPIRRVHIFIAGPNGFTFFLAQHQQIIGRATLYEWDFEDQRGGGYSQSLTIGA
jgi:SMODS-associated and fused to various effectors sensor domain